MAELRNRGDAEERAVFRRRQSPYGFGAAAWRDVTSDGQDGKTVLAIVTDTMGDFVEVEAEVPRADKLDDELLEAIEAGIESRIGPRDRQATDPLGEVASRSPYVMPEVWLRDDADDDGG